MYRVSRRFAGAAVAVLLSAAAVSAASIRIETETFAVTDMAGARAAYAGHASGAAALVVEDFEDLASWNGGADTPNPVDTRAGRIRGESALPGSGGSKVGSGMHLQVRDETPMWGRANTSPGGRNWLDSNDMERMIWDADGASGLGVFDSLMFFLTDVGDIHGTDFTVSVAAAGLDAASVHIAPQANGAIDLVRILFDRPVAGATVTLASARNDGFGIDDLTVARATPVPLPAAALPLLAALAGLGAVGRGRGRSRPCRPD